MAEVFLWLFVTKALRWVRLGTIRHATTLIAGLAALKALSLIGR